MRSLCFILACVAAICAYDCPSGYTGATYVINGLYQLYCYKVYTTFYDRQQAVSQCAQDGGTLATITSDAINNILMNADQITGSLTFGLSCRDSSNCAFDDGTPFDRSVSYNNFAGGYPDTSYGECVALETMGFGRGKWSSVPCSMYGAFVCHYNPNSLISQQSGCNSISILTANGYTVNITSPNYPQGYLNSQSCTYFLQSSGNGLNVTFTDFYVESCCDKVRIYSGGISQNGTFLGMYTGQLGSFTVLIPSREAFITFTTDASVVYRGFSAIVNYYYP